MMELTGKIALVTGGSRGIGRAIALALARDGARVAVNYARQAERAAAVVGEIEGLGGQALAIPADLSRVADVRALFGQVVRAFGRPDILINNAATAGFGPLAEVTEEEFDRQFTLNVKGAFFCLQEAARHLADGGRIVNISSGITQFGGPGAAVYAGTKGAMEQFTRCAAQELGPRGITVNTVSPGITRTDLLQTVVPEAAQTSMIERTPLRRLGEPEDIADVVRFLCGEAGRWITGQNLRATGGAP